MGGVAWDGEMLRQQDVGTIAAKLLGLFRLQPPNMHACSSFVSFLHASTLGASQWLNVRHNS